MAIELPEPSRYMGDTYYFWPDSNVNDAQLGSCQPRAWYASDDGDDYGENDKKRYHDTPEAAAAWLASRGYGPGANQGEGER